VVQPKHGTRVGIAPRTDQPLANAQPPLTETQADISDVAAFLPERYKPIKKLGQGGMGTVYQCLDRALERQVAIKIMMDRYRSDPQSERRFMREARAQAIVNHPNVCTVQNFGISPEGRPFLVMEYLEGLDLRSIIRHDKLFDPLRACTLVQQVSDGLQEAHAAGLVHRDLKPSNVMVVRDHRGLERAKILDLGLAKIVGGPTDLKSITMDTAGMLVGTPAYMSPEQVAGSSVDGRADLYALGVVFFEMLTGRLPYESETMEGWLYQHLHAKPPPPTQFNRALMQYPALDRLVLWLLAKQPKERPSSAGELSQILGRLIERNLEGDAPRLAKRSGPRAALSFEENPPAKKSGPRGALDVLMDAPPPPPDGEVNAAGVAINPPPAPHIQDAEKEKERTEKRAKYEEAAHAAEAAESARTWQLAIDHWSEALPYAEKPETVQPRLLLCRREMEFEEQLERANKACNDGDWEDAVKTADRLSRQRQTDPRIEQLRARLPQRLIQSWQRIALEKATLVPEGEVKQSILERLAIAYAQTGDMQSAFAVLQDATTKTEGRAVGLAQAIIAAVQNAQHEGLRPFLDKACSSAASINDPSERGRAQLEIGRAFAAYGDETSAAAAYQTALTSYGESFAKGIPMHAAAKRMAGMLRKPTDMRSVLLTTTSMTGPKALKSSYEYAVGTVAEAQAESGLVEDALASAATIDDAWTFAHTLSKVAQAFARIGRLAEAENLSYKIGFAMPKTQAFRAVAVSKIYAGELSGAEDILKVISAPADRMAIFGLLSTAYALRNDNGRAAQRVGEVQRSVAEVTGARARFQALMGAAEPLLQSGFTDYAAPLVQEAMKLMDLIDDPAERVRSLLQQGQLLETARDSKQLATRTIILESKPSPEFIETLKRALVVWRQVRQAADRLECIERLCFVIAWGDVYELSNEALSTCRDNAESALGYIGFCTGMS